MEPARAAAAGDGAGEGIDQRRRLRGVRPPPALSETHRHLLAVVNTELAKGAIRAGATVRVLDAGCGDGLLLGYLVRALAQCWPQHRFEFHGFDVSDHGVQPDGFFAAARRHLEAEAPSQDWRGRLSLIRQQDHWPYAGESFDVVVSNQVLEHVGDHRFFFGQLARVLRKRGFSAHVYPSMHRLVEPHLNVPAAHRIGDRETLAAWLRLWSRLGVSTYRGWARARSAAGLPPEATSVDAYAREHADFLKQLTNYRTQHQMREASEGAELEASFAYTGPYYTGKLRSLAGRVPLAVYRDARPFAAAAANLVLRHVSSVTLLARRDGEPALKPRGNGRA